MIINKKLRLLVGFLLSLFLVIIVLQFCEKDISAKVKKDEQDVKALQEIIEDQEKLGVSIEHDLDDEDVYEWDTKTGKLKKLNWSLSGIRAYNLEELYCDNIEVIR